MLHEIAPENNVAVARGGFVRDRLTGKYVQKITITNNNATALNGPFYLVLDSLNPANSLSNSTGTTSVYLPSGSPYIVIPGGALAPGGSASVTLQLTNPTNGAITYTPRVLNSIVTP